MGPSRRMRRDASAGARLGAAAAHARIRCARYSLRAKARRLDRHGHDGKAGRFRCTSQHHSSCPFEPTAPIALPDTNGFFLRRNAMRTSSLRKAGAGLSCFFMPQAPARRHPERHLYSTPKGQARQSFECVLRSRVRGRVGAPFWARKVAAFRPSSRWVPSRASIAAREAPA